jgi:hypothetical protein
LQKYLDLSFLGKSLVHVDEEILKENNPLGISKWYHGKNFTDLFIWIFPKGGIEKFQILFLDNFIEWSDTDGIQSGNFELTGHIVKDEGTTGFGRIEEIVFSYDNEYDKNKIDMAVKLLEHSKISQGDSEFMLGRIKNV